MARPKVRRVWETSEVSTSDKIARTTLLRRGFALGYATLAWNVAGIVVLAVAALAARWWRWLGSGWTR